MVRGVRGGDQVEERLLDGGGAAAAAEFAGGVVGEELACAHEEEAVAALGLVHDVGGDEEGGAAVGGDAVEEVPQVAAEDRVEADGGLVEDEQVRGAEQGDGQGERGCADRRRDGRRGRPRGR